MHIEFIEDASEDPDSPEPDPTSNSLNFDDDGTFAVVELTTGEACFSLLDMRWSEIFQQIDRFLIKDIIEKTLISGPHPNHLPDRGISLAIIASDNAHMQQLNFDFRHKKMPTNVLSFPDGVQQVTEDEYHLGDIFLGYEIVKSEAEKQNIPLKNHFLHLLVHGVLHLLGYDHEEEQQAHIMEQKETEILLFFHIPDPYSL
ncbi:rRNA maturation RNase YbeY [Alphaproteobacteria bacterium]|jgi:probable rRNA maturation factor|nr:rRNA maturation RNase YbeY [Alphaproteobacteria bacterium]MBT5798236.1 rRNA maturation RNase YbeY [Alphaproteobacteria bacterium]MDA9190182.1 rRNA maturation RNase YbeY [Alphaproteobacteria bacterium]